MIRVFRHQHVGQQLRPGRPRSIGRPGGRRVELIQAAAAGNTLEGIVQLQSGTASNVRTGTDRANVGKTNERPNVLRNPNLPNDQRTVDLWFDTSAFVMPDFFTWGTAGAYMIEDDGRATFDFSVAKRFRFAERQSVEVRGEFFHFPNHPDFGAPGSGGYVITDTSYGVISSTTASRQVQFALRYSFQGESDPQRAHLLQRGDAPVFCLYSRSALLLMLRLIVDRGSTHL